MSKRLIAMALTFLVAAILLYLSRFWIFELWARPGLFSINELRPQGGLLGRWLRGTSFAPFELLIWAVGLFLVLTWLQKLLDFFNRPNT
jgi:hypothetical protein